MATLTMKHCTMTQGTIAIHQTVLGNSVSSPPKTLFSAKAFPTASMRQHIVAKAVYSTPHNTHTHTSTSLRIGIATMHLLTLDWMDAMNRNGM